MKSISITCYTGDNLSLDELTQFQGKFKFRENDDIFKVKQSILKYGFSFPFLYGKAEKQIIFLMGTVERLPLKNFVTKGLTFLLFQ